MDRHTVDLLRQHAEGCKLQGNGGGYVFLNKVADELEGILTHEDYRIRRLRDVLARIVATDDINQAHNIACKELV